MKKSRTNNKGFTLMEVVIAISLLAIVSVVSVSIVANLIKSAVKSQSAVEIEQTSNFVLLKLKSDLQKSTRVVVSTNQLDIYQSGSSNPVVYSVSACNTNTNPNIYCIKRGTTKLTDDTSDPNDATKPNKSSVGVSFPSGYSVYFIPVPASGDPLAVNITIRFYKPGVATTGNFSGESVLDTTIVLPKS